MLPTYATLLVATISQLALGVHAVAIDTPTKRLLSGWGYATFYNDNACTQGAGQAVSMGNAGCLANELGRNSIYVQPGDYSVTGTVSLVWSPGNNCNCQNDCASIANNGNNNFCMNLNGHAPAESFRFITQGCAANNC